MPPQGIWRVGRGPNPIARPPASEDLVLSSAGNRFDSEAGQFSILYFGTTLEACFGETLSRFRPSAQLIAAIGDEWRKLGFMEIGAVPAEWRQRRSAVRVALPDEARFLDVESVNTHQHLTAELATGLSTLGYSTIDVGIVRGPDRRVSRMIAAWAYRQANELGEPAYAGLRYLSRLHTDWECWAVFDDIPVEPVETRPITKDLPQLQQVAELFELVVH